MKRQITYLLIALLLLGGCSTAANPPNHSMEQETVHVQEAASPSDKQENAAGNDLDTQKEQPLDKKETAENKNSNTAESIPESSADIDIPAPQETPEDHSPFDAASALSVKAVENGKQYIFSSLPQTAEDLEALLELYGQDDGRNTAAYFIAALVRYIDSPEDGLAMIDILRGPRPMNDMDKSFIKDRLMDKAYLPQSYFEGATPQNDYTPNEPWTLVIYDDPAAAEEGCHYVQAATTGGDAKRRITMRIKDDRYYLWSYSNILVGIRLPASQDPWA